MSITLSDYAVFANEIAGLNSSALGNLSALGRVTDGLIPFTLQPAAQSLTAAGIRMAAVVLPPGRYHIFPSLSFISFTDTFAFTADGHLGHGPFHKADGTAVARDDNEWLDNSDIAGGAIAGAWSDGATTGIFATGAGGAVDEIDQVYDAADGLVIEVFIDTATTNAIEASTTIRGFVMVKNLSRA